jgi:NTP pyrophosphatase (non-canonical NTP hydrolase)
VSLTEPERRAIAEVLTELDRARLLHPEWPASPYAQLAVILEELGELAQAVLDAEYSGGDPARVRAEAVQVAAMGLRFLVDG